jgi:hypothetical protein
VRLRVADRFEGVAEEELAAEFADERPNRAIALLSSQRSFSTVSGSPSC